MNQLPIDGTRRTESSSADACGHWRDFARQWQIFGSPLRPCSDDVSIVEELLAGEPELFGANAKKRAWLLGVTPEIAAARPLQEIDLFAVERVRAMIDSAWPGDTETRWAICGDWLRAPFADGNFDLAIGDGCLTVVGFPGQLQSLLGSVYRCLRRDGCLLLRLFCQPDVAEAPAAVIDAVRCGAIGSFHAFKWRLAMAVQGIADAPDVAVDAIWRAWHAAQIDAQELAGERGWSLAEVGTMEFYRGSPARYNFMRFDATIRHLQQAGFELVATRTGNYELAERCPHILLKKRTGGSTKSAV